MKELAAIAGLPDGAVHLVGETTLAGLKSRPDFDGSVETSGAKLAAPDTLPPLRLDVSIFSPYRLVDKIDMGRMPWLLRPLFTARCGMSMRG